MIASHYAEPVERKLSAATLLRAAPTADGEEIGELQRHEPFRMLDECLGWAWGYAGANRRVGYVPSSALEPQ